MQKEDEMKKIITYGTFDLFHEGHYNILKKAKECGDYLIVGVTGDNYDIERGKLSVHDSLSVRIENVKKTGFADLVIVEEYLGQKIHDIINYNVDMLVVGSDWKGKFDHLNKYCEVKYLERTKDISSTLIRSKVSKIYKLGIIANDLYDNEIISETNNISGLHVEGVYSYDSALAEEFADKYELHKGYTSFDDFLNNVDIVYVKSLIRNREYLIESALKKGKHVISEAPISLHKKNLKHLYKLAEQNKVTLLYNFSLLYLNSFNQLLWMCRSNIIGDLISIKCSVSKSSFNEKRIFDIAFYPICMSLKIMGIHYDNYVCKVIRDEDMSIAYCYVLLEYNNSFVTMEINDRMEMKEDFTIIGTKGTIYIKDGWWNLGYFKMKLTNENSIRRYSYNFEGNGFRYVLRYVLQRLRNLDIPNQRVSVDEMCAMIDIYNTLFAYEVQLLEGVEDIE